jgi:DNA-binding phage protein
MSAKQRLRFSDQLRRAVDQSGLSRYEICKRAGLDQSVMHRFMHERSGLSMATVDAICKTLGLELVKRQSPGMKKGK